MAKVNMNTGGIGQIYGRVNAKNKRTGYYYRRGYRNETILVQADWELQDASAAQMAARTRFANASRLASADMQDPEKKEEWQAVVDASNGKYVTAYGAAFANYYRQGTNPDGN